MKNHAMIRPFTSDATPIGNWMGAYRRAPPPARIKHRDVYYELPGTVL